MSCNCNDDASVIESNAIGCEPDACTPACTPTCPSTNNTLSPCTCSGACGCQSGVPATPAPFYAQAPGCEESHSQVIVQNQYVTGLMISNTVNMPAVHLPPAGAATTTLIIPGLSKINVGSFLWHPVYGYLKVVGFDYASSTVTVTNEGQALNASAGTEIRSCTLFTVVDNPSDAGPCANTLQTSGALLVCKDGVVAPLDGTVAGQIPVLANAATNEVIFTSVDVPLKLCTALNSDLTLIPANGGPYAITVLDSTIFSGGDLLQIDGRTDRYLVTGVPDGTHLTVTVSPVPAGFEVIGSGSEVCAASCCEQIELDLAAIYGWQAAPCDWDLSSRFGMYATRLSAAPMGAPISIAPDLAERFGDTVTTTIVNTKCGTMNIMVNCNWAINYNFHMVGAPPPPGGGLEGTIDLVLNPMFAFAVGAIGAVGAVVPVSIHAYLDTKVQLPWALAHTNFYSWAYSSSHIISITQGMEAVLSAATSIKLDYVGPDFDLYGITALNSSFSIFTVTM